LKILNFFKIEFLKQALSSYKLSVCQFNEIPFVVLFWLLQNKWEIYFRIRYCQKYIYFKRIV